MKILAFGASNSRNSVNKAVASFVANRIEGGEVKLIDLNAYEMPIYSIDRERETGVPKLAQEFKNEIAVSDLVVISFAVHNGSYSVAFKNIFDWASRLEGKVFDGARVLVLAASPGPAAGQPLLDIVAGAIPHFGGEVLGKLGIGKIGDKLEDGQIIDAQTLAEIDSLIGSIK